MNKAFSRYSNLVKLRGKFEGSAVCYTELITKKMSIYCCVPSSNTKLVSRINNDIYRQGVSTLICLLNLTANSEYYQKWNSYIFHLTLYIVNCSIMKSDLMQETFLMENIGHLVHIPTAVSTFCPTGQDYMLLSSDSRSYFHHPQPYHQLG